MTGVTYNIPRGEYSMDDYKIATITDKRQITIPKQIFNELKLKSGKVKCYVSDGKIVIEPFTNKSFWDFSSNILKDLVAEGYQGQDLINEFDSRKLIVRESFALMAGEAVKEIKEGRGKDSEIVFAEIISELQSKREK